jgi:hypothetical protein
MKWHSTEIMRFFDMLPVEGEHGLYQQFITERSPLRLQVTIWPYDAEVEIVLWAEPFALPIIRHRLHKCLGIRPRQEKSGSHIDFFAAVEQSDRYDEDSPLIHGIRLWMEPQVRIDFLH